MPRTTSSSRVLWKGAISFGLVHIPVALHAASHDTRLDFDWLDKRTMDRVGYKRINKTTGEEIEREDVVKGIEVEDGEYVVLSDDEIAAAYPKSTQTIEIEAFVGADEIPPMFLERPYYIEPINKGAKVYALLRETLRASGKVGVARVVISTKEHLAMLMPCGAGMLLNLLRWGEGIRPIDALNLPPEDAKEAGVQPRELKMAEQLVDDMTTAWNPDDFHDRFSAKIMELVERRAKAGKLESVTKLEDDGESAGAEIIDLTALLKRSLRGKAGGGNGADEDDGESEDADGGKSAKSGSRSKSASASRASAEGTKGKASAKAAVKKSAAKRSAPAKPAQRRAA